jgi:crotonobetainyl-CoA:carnitine CoA-transferase CaiB-like acyl-CoA transferase
LTRPEGLDGLARITEQSDVVLTNALPEAGARLGIHYATVAARNPATCREPGPVTPQASSV